MDFEQLVAQTRTYRRFDETHTLDEETLVDLVKITTLCPSAANRQPLKYMISWEPERNELIFPHLRWAMALPDWPGPAEGERPTGYIVILGDNRITGQFHWDDAIVAHAMLMRATEQGLGGCMIGSIDRDQLRAELGLPNHLKILLVVAIGKPVETVVLESGQSPDERPYWRDADDAHHVPKRGLDEVLLREWKTLGVSA